MKMQETPKSLKAYLIIRGTLGLLASFTILAVAKNYFSQGLILFSILIAGGFIYFGIKLYNYLEKSPKTVINFVITATCIDAILYLLFGAYLYMILAALLGWYLAANIKRLSRVTS